MGDVTHCGGCHCSIRNMTGIDYRDFDGRNWELHCAALAGLSQK